MLKNYGNGKSRPHERFSNELKYYSKRMLKSIMFYS